MQVNQEHQLYQVYHHMKNHNQLTKSQMQDIPEVQVN